MYCLRSVPVVLLLSTATHFSWPSVFPTTSYQFPVSRAQSPASSSSSSSTSSKPCSLSRLFHSSFNCHSVAVKTLLPAVANMAKINPCFKKIFITFNALFAILGVVIFSLAMIGHRYTSQIPNMYGVIALYVIGSIIFIFSCLGVFAAYKESKWALIVFFVLMCVTTIILLRVAVPTAISKPEFISTVKDEFRKMSLTKDMVPAFDIIQSSFHCCGLSNGYRDWNGQIPESCNCDNGGDQSRMCVRTTNDQNLYLFRSSENRWVWSKPCGYVIIYYVEKLLNIFLGLMFGLAALSILGGMMSFGMIIRVSSLDHSPSQFSSEFPSLSLSYSPPKYSEVVNY